MHITQESPGYWEFMRCIEVMDHVRGTALRGYQRWQVAGRCSVFIPRLPTTGGGAWRGAENTGEKSKRC